MDKSGKQQGRENQGGVGVEALKRGRDLLGLSLTAASQGPRRRAGPEQVLTRCFVGKGVSEAPGAGDQGRGGIQA